MPVYRVSVYYSTRAYVDVKAVSVADAEETVSEMDWRSDAFTIADGSAEIEDIEEITPGPGLRTHGPHPVTKRR